MAGKNNIFTILLSIIIVCSFIIGFYQLCEKNGLLTERVSLFSSAVLNINRSINDAGETETDAEVDNEKNIADFLLFLGSLYISISFVFNSFVNRRLTISQIIIANRDRPSLLKFLMWWSLKVISPVRMCMKNKAGIYDDSMECLKKFYEKTARYSFKYRAVFL